ncbi:hypothetical protein [Actinomadura sp. 9N215]|uniref:hypothetical protein n=1 Tax=Actinomadura sp. 9N215 TaxID=3375150 RepID=UPI00378B5EB8
MTKTRTADPNAEAPESRADESTAETTEPEPSARKSTDAKPPRGLSKGPLIKVALAVTVIAALVCAWFGHAYRSASDDASLTYAAERDRVLAAADQAIVNLNTLDHRDVDGGLKVWQDSSTAQLYDEIVQGRARLKSDIEKAQTTSTAKVLESALTELDTRAGKAAVIAAVNVTITRADGKPVSNLRRFAGQLTRTSSGWKLSALGQAPTGTP